MEHGHISPLQMDVSWDGVVAVASRLPDRGAVFRPARQGKAQPRRRPRAGTDVV